jgi:hypothetical protein
LRYYWQRVVDENKNSLTSLKERRQRCSKEEKEEVKAEKEVADRCLCLAYRWRNILMIVIFLCCLGRKFTGSDEQNIQTIMGVIEANACLAYWGFTRDAEIHPAHTFLTANVNLLQRNTGRRADRDILFDEFGSERDHSAIITLFARIFQETLPVLKISFITFGGMLSLSPYSYC